MSTTSDSTSEQSSSDDEKPRKYSPESWDSLPSIRLTRTSLRELNRRNRIIQPVPPLQNHVSLATDLVDFARHGGPNLEHLRGYAEAQDMPQAKLKKIGPYDPGFDDHCERHGIHLLSTSKPPNNLMDIRAALFQDRQLSKEESSDDFFESFIEKSRRVNNEGDANDLFGHIKPRVSPWPMASNTLFNNLATLTDGKMKRAKPDVYYGTYIEDFDDDVIQDLSSYIRPTSSRVPAAPNVFVEIKGPDGRGVVAYCQARHYGAIGARAMHKLRWYLADESFDDNAYCLTVTFVDGVIGFFAHHVTKSEKQGQDRALEYHMTEVHRFILANNADEFRQGIRAFLNAADLGEMWRRGFVAEANRRAEGARQGAEETKKRQRGEQNDNEDDEDEDEDEDEEEGEGNRPPTRKSRRITGKSPGSEETKKRQRGEQNDDENEDEEGGKRNRPPTRKSRRIAGKTPGSEGTKAYRA